MATPIYKNKGLKDTEICVHAVRSDNKEFEYEGVKWRVTKLDGLATPQIELFNEKKGVGHGTYVTGSRYDARDVDISARAQLKATITADRETAVNFHSLDYTYTLYFFYMGRFAVLENCKLQGFKCTNDKTMKRSEIEVSYYQADPVIAKTGYYETETIEKSSSNTYPLPSNTSYSEASAISYVEFQTGEGQECSYCYCGGDQYYFAVGTYLVPANSTVRLAQDYIDDVKVVIAYVNGVEKMRFNNRTLAYTGNFSMRCKVDGSYETLRPDSIDVRYAHAGDTNVRGI